MNARLRKITAAFVCVSMTASLIACSKDERERDYEGDRLTLPTAASTTEESIETDPTDTTDTTDTSATDTDATDTSATDTSAPAPTTVQGGLVTISSDLTYPDHIAEYDEVHPSVAPGDVTGQEASDLLDKIELDVIGHSITDYYDATLLFEHPENYGIEIGEVSWGDYSSDNDVEIEFYSGVLEELRSIDYENLDYQDRVFYDKILFDTEETLYGLQYTAFGYYESALNPLTSFQSEVLFLLEILTFDSVEDAEDYIALVADTARYLGQMCDFEEEKASYGFALPSDTYEAIAATFDDLVAQTNTCFLYDSFEERLDNISGLTDDQRDELISAHEAAMTDSFFPGMQDCADRMRALKSYDAEPHGMCDYPGGDAYYAYMVRILSNDYVRPEDALSSTIETATAAMDEMRTISLSGSYDMSEYLSPDYSMGDMRDNLDYLYDKIKDDFPGLHEHSYFTMDVPEEFEDSFSPAAYLGYHLDNYDSNMIITNNSGVDGSFGITCAHEGYPGHMFDSVYHREFDEHPYMFLFNSIGYSEGWATYVEGYAHKYFGTDEGARRLNQIEDELNLYIGAIMDLGIHVEGWDADECASRLSSIMGYSLSASSIDYIYNLLLADPCYYVKYGIGFINTCNVIATLHEEFPNATDLEIHTAYLNAEEGTFSQILEHAREQLS